MIPARPGPPRASSIRRRGAPSSATAASPNSSNPMWRRRRLRRHEGRCECYLVPVDICYELVGRMRLLCRASTAAPRPAPPSTPSSNTSGDAPAPYARRARRDGVRLRLHRCARGPGSPPGLTLVFRLRITATGDEPVHAMALRCQIRIEPAKRGYETAEAEGLADLFGERSRWAAPSSGAVRPGLRHGPRLHRGDRDGPRRAVHVRHGDRPATRYFDALTGRRGAAADAVLRHGVHRVARLPVHRSREPASVVRMPMQRRQMVEQHFPSAAADPAAPRQRPRRSPSAPDGPCPPGGDRAGPARRERRSSSRTTPKIQSPTGIASTTGRTAP